MSLTMRFIPLVLCLIVAATLPALAQGKGQGKGQGNEQSEAGNGQSQASGQANGNSQNNGNGGGAAASRGGPYAPDYAREAVNAGEAVGLGNLLPDLKERTAGEVIDAELLRVDGILVYAVRVLRTDGVVTTEYYAARSGRFMGSGS